MKRPGNIRSLLSFVLTTLSVGLLMGSIFLHRIPGNTDRAAARLEKRIAARMALLDRYVRYSAESGIPDDMVIYRYRRDSLVFWQNQFPVMNDDISPKSMFSVLVNPRRGLISSLAEIADSVVFTNLGPKWYLVSACKSGDDRIISALEIVDTRDNKSFNGVNQRLHLGRSFSIRPLSTDGGSPVMLNSRPVFRVTCDSVSASAASESDNGGMIWAAFLLFALVALISLKDSRTLHRFLLYAVSLVAVSAVMLVWGHYSSDLIVFSPLLFAGGRILHSLGVVIILNLLFALLATGLFVVRDSLKEFLCDRLRRALFLLLSTVASAGLLAYAHAALRSIIMNSGIHLAVFNVQDLSWWSLIVYLSFLTMLMSVPLLVALNRAALEDIFGWKLEFRNKRVIGVFCALLTAFVFAVVTRHGMRKEENMMEVWANRLAVERDISLEMWLRRTEPRIAGDGIISSLTAMENSDYIIQNVLVDNYLSRFTSDYRISTAVFREGEQPGGWVAELLQGSEPLTEGSSFFYREGPTGLPVYTGIFGYYNEGAGLSRVLVEIEPKFAYGEKGYMALLGSDSPGRMRLPSGFSSARYRGRNLYNYNGSFPYSVTMNDALYSNVRGHAGSSFKSEGFRHFVTLVTEDESVLISRPVVSWFAYLTQLFFIYLLFILLFWLLMLDSKRRPEFRSYYKTRLSLLMMTGLAITLVIMAVTSVIFMYKRNTSVINTILSDKVTSIQSMLQEGMGAIERDRANMKPLLENASIAAGTDITLYFADGHLMASTSPDLYERSIASCRISHEAFENIIRRHRRCFMSRETMDGHIFYSMYAPLLDRQGKVAAILSAPYMGSEVYDFEIDAINNLVSIIVLFLVLLLVAHVLLERMFESMFNPLAEIGRKMENIDLDSMTHISYDRNDELSALVRAYNRMVTQLAENTRALAQAERDKAWSGMARQVAHEIKNPLTPMKLQLQRLIRLKSKGDPGWQERFDDVSKVILDHIDVLTETANEFSTFAKLYSEEPTEVNLDSMLQEEISMFDNRENVKFVYMGLEGVKVMAPKPQLTRVFVNLLGNAVQAVEDVGGGEIMVSLRKSLEDGYYDIVFEDSGPGVSEEHRNRLFTPNFTTKSSGTGLGLAISRSILEKCEAKIEYSRSFHLGGACFLIRYPM